MQYAAHCRLTDVPVSWEIPSWFSWLVKCWKVHFLFSSGSSSGNLGNTPAPLKSLVVLPSTAVTAWKHLGPARTAVVRNVGGKEARSHFSSIYSNNRRYARTRAHTHSHTHKEEIYTYKEKAFLKNTSFDKKRELYKSIFWFYKWQVWMSPCLCIQLRCRMKREYVFQLVSVYISRHREVWRYWIKKGKEIEGILFCLYTELLCLNWKAAFFSDVYFFKHFKYHTGYRKSSKNMMARRDAFCEGYTTQSV